MFLARRSAIAAASNVSAEFAALTRLSRNEPLVKSGHSQLIGHVSRQVVREHAESARHGRGFLSRRCR